MFSAGGLRCVLKKVSEGEQSFFGLYFQGLEYDGFKERFENAMFGGELEFLGCGGA